MGSVNADKLFVAVALGFFVVAFAGQTMAQQTGQQSASRDAAIHGNIMEWRSQVAVVTGGARGLGRATARLKRGPVP